MGTIGKQHVTLPLAPVVTRHASASFQGMSGQLSLPCKKTVSLGARGKGQGPEGGLDTGILSVNQVYNAAAVTPPLLIVGHASGMAPVP